MMGRVYKNVLKTILVVSLLITLVSCASQETKTGEGKPDENSKPTYSEKGDKEEVVEGTLLIFTEREAGSDAKPFTTRIFVSREFLHLSDSYSPADFVLLNRAERTIYNVNQEDKSIFVIKNKPHEVRPPFEISYVGKSQPSSAIPKIDGRQATHYRFYANDKHCYDSVVLGEDFLPDVLAALREFRQVLANEHAATVHRIPFDMLDACDLSVNIFHATQHMEHGLPIREWDRRGYQRFLKDYRENIRVPEDIFILPKSFKQYSLEDMQSSAGH